jgi:hypothetical protein
MRYLALGLGAGLIALLVANLVDTTLYQGYIMLLFFTYLGLIDAMVGLTKSVDVKEEPGGAPGVVSTPSTND